MNKENKENLIPVKGLSPFKRFCMTIGELPASYLETMTYYEMLVWFTKYMQDTVIPTINNNASAVDELQDKYIEFTDNLLDRQTTFENNLTERQENYEEEVMTLFNNLQDFVNNYFNNLDVQEEINNKLDDMVEQGTLQEIIADYLNSKAIFGFNNVSSMKQATNLINGSYARTLGYYNINDGGTATYKIRNKTIDDVVDNGSIIELDNNTLVAELIVKNGINVKQFGAYGDGIHDDITSLQTAIDFIDNKQFNLGRSAYQNMLVIPGGKYKISTTLNLKTTVKLRTEGLSSIEYYGTGVAVRIMNDWQSTPDDRFNAREWLSGAFIDGTGLIIKNMNATDTKDAEDRGDTVGLEIGDRSVNDYNSINETCTGNIKNIRICNFNIGIKYNAIYSYIIDFNSVNVFRCNICVQLGNTGVAVNNGTEKISFTNCFICDSDTGFLWKNTPIHVSIYNSSLDYLNALFVTENEYNNPANVDVFGGHIEGITEGTASNPTGYMGLLDGYFKRSTVTFNSPIIAINRKPNLITSNSLNANLRVIFNSVTFTYSSNTDTMINADYCLLSTVPIEVHTVSSNSYIPDYNDGSRSILLRTISKYNSLFPDNTFSNLETGNIDITNGSDIGYFKVSASGSIASGSITTDSPIGGKVLTLNTEGTNSTFELTSDKISAKSNTWYKANYLSYNATSFRICFVFYDINNNVLYTSNDSASNLNNSKNTWYASPYSKTAKAPSGTAYMKVKFKFITSDNSDISYIKIGGLFVEEI